jgi:hypothetical protein
MNHVVLLGDSIFDNAAYVNGGTDVHGHLKQILPHDWHISLLAKDGSVTRGVTLQCDQIPATATHLIISSGGNDALAQIGILNESADSVAEVLTKMARIGDSFQQHYHNLIKRALTLKLPIVLCSIYNPRMEDAQEQRQVVTGLVIFNDIIMREAIRYHFPLIDLRAVCDEDADFAQAIEPSEVGGAKIAAVVAEVLLHHDFSRMHTEIYVHEPA